MWFGRTFTNRLFEKVVRWKNEKKKKKKLEEVGPLESQT